MLEGARVSRHVGQRPLVSKGRAFVVDEDRGDLAYYRSILQRLGWTVVTSSSYMEALDHLKSESFDLVVISQGTCSFEGRLVLERALMMDRKRPVLVVARSLDMGCYLEAMRMGATDYLEGPVPETELTRATEASLSGATVAA
jgi:DNA-binding NtrC family response regulator